MDKNETIAQAVLEAVGGKENVAFATHCMTRLRLKLKDDALVNETALKDIKGVLGTNRVGEQLQVIIGGNVEPVYHYFCNLAGVQETEQIQENLDGAASGKLKPKDIGTAILDYVSGSIAPFLPAIMTAGLFKTIQVVLGPMLLGIISDESDFAFVCNMVYQAVFYFMPVYVAYSAAHKLHTSKILALLIACLLIEPTFVARVGEGTALTVYGIPAPLNTYSQTVLPILLSVWVMSYVERFFNKHIPDLLRTLFAPFLTMAVMLPIVFCLLAPLGNYAGEIINLIFSAIANAGGIVSILGIALLTAIQPPLVVTGMHQVIGALAITTALQTGSEGFVLVSNLLSNFAIWAVGLAAFLRFKDEDSKMMSLNCLVSGALGGISEPTLFGLCLTHPRAFIGTGVGGFCAGLIAAIGGARVYSAGATSVLEVLNFVDPAGGSSFVWACVAGAVGFVVSLVVTYFFGFSKEDVEKAAQK